MQFCLYLKEMWTYNIIIIFASIAFSIYKDNSLFKLISFWKCRTFSSISSSLIAHFFLVCPEQGFIPCDSCEDSTLFVAYVV